MDLSKTATKTNNQSIHCEKSANILFNGLPNQSEASDKRNGTSITSMNGSGDGLIWKNGVGSLPGCENLQFRKSANGDIELITDGLPEMNPDFGHVQNLSVTSNGDNKQDRDAHLNPHNGKIKTDNQSSTIENDLPANCPVCGVSRALVGFTGKLCSSKCVAKNANIKRNMAMQMRKEMQMKYHAKQASAGNQATENNNEEAARSKDLKIRIRLPSSTVENSGSGSRKRKSTSDINIIGEKKPEKFSWNTYQKNGAVLAPVSAFKILNGKNPFPGTNQFKLGMALEGVDPVHQSLICPLSVTAVKGFRIRLHFCGYSESYDFWTNADSPHIFPCGFCEKTGRKLEPPKGLLSENFNWEKYMKKFRLYAAPDVIFSVISDEKDCSFKAEEKLEAVDKHNPDLICAATIADVIGENILIHFDGWTHDFDYWCKSSSRLIHPIGWCEKQGKVLTPPEGYPHERFCWNVYLRECGSKAAAESSFTSTLEPHGLEAGMKLEAADIRNPILIRVATIVSVNDYRMEIHFDGWSNIYDYSTDLESMDIHPAGWCVRANFPLQPPMTEEDKKTIPGQSGCPVTGCIGVGHIRGSKFAGHHSEFGCPYSQQNLQKYKNYLMDRLSKSRTSSSVQELGGYKSGSDGESNEQGRPPKIRRTRKSLMLEAQRSSSANSFGKKSPTPPNNETKKSVISSSQLTDLIDEHGKSHYSAQDHSVFVSTLSSFPNYDLPLCWDQQSKILPNVKGLKVDDVVKWSMSEVSAFVGDITGRPEYGKLLANEEIDGEAFLLLTQVDIAKVLNIKLGPALKIYNSILLIKAAEHRPV